MDSAALREDIPNSRIPYPKGILNQSKYFAWKIITHYHNFWRNFLLKINILEHNFRQDYLLGTLAPDKNMEELVIHLKNNGWGKHHIAWQDTDAEIMSVRKIVDFEHQYHLRVFSDGEIRGHFEYTPEAHAIWHTKEIGVEPAREAFLNFLGDYITPVTLGSSFRED